ncbi:hypothetical protein FBU30_011145 [Linnemannia zychae]|nr:hypothetical protein FBU30_011145 [Linnemannia zychae]
MSPALSTTTMVVAILIISFCSLFAVAQSTSNNPDIASVAFTLDNNPESLKTTLNLPFKTCAQVPSQATSFSSLANKAVFAIYQDDACKNYLYSVKGSLANMEGIKSMTFDQIDSSNARAEGVTFADSSIPVQNSASTVSRKVLIAIFVCAGIVFFAFGSLSLWFLERKKKNSANRNAIAPSIELSEAGLPLYSSKSHEAIISPNASSISVASSISYLPAYNMAKNANGHNTYTSS